MSETLQQQPVGVEVPELDVPGLIRRVRRTCDLNQRELAARLGVSQSTVGRWETGDDDPSVSVFAQLVALVVPELPEYFCWGRPVQDRRARGRCHPKYRVPSPRVVADDHPSEDDISGFVAAWRKHRKEQQQKFDELLRAAQLARDPSCEDPCHCLADCFEVPGCLTTCACQCEGVLFEPGGTEPVGWRSGG